MVECNLPRAEARIDRLGIDTNICKTAALSEAISEMRTMVALVSMLRPGQSQKPALNCASLETHVQSRTCGR